MATKIAIPPHAPYHPAPLSSDLVYAVKAIAAGEADRRQQALFLQWLIVEVCKKDDLSFRPGAQEADRDSAFAEGKRFVAISVLKPINMPPDQVAAMRTRELMERGAPITEGDELGRPD